MNKIMIRPFSSLIKKVNNPCSKCTNYIRRPKDPYDELYGYQENYGNCAIFGRENLVTGHVEYDSALTCRLDEFKCGKNGKYFSHKK